MLSVVSIDIGLKNLAIYKEYFNMSLAKTIEKPKRRYDKYGAAHPEMNEYINKSKADLLKFIQEKIVNKNEKDQTENRKDIGDIKIKNQEISLRIKMNDEKNEKLIENLSKKIDK